MYERFGKRLLDLAAALLLLVLLAPLFLAVAVAVLVGPGVAAGRNAVAWPQRLELGADYAARPPRLSLDLMLAWRSLWVLLRGQGVTAPGHATMPSFTPPGPRDPFA
ncbi:MAG: hypothetical protein B7Z53_03620 [Rhodospirillales bacterium 12-71-4]|nr:MAG: hypothetical protein B7Z53_03620 [Rhodospirillales bacterium 12-71-4]